MVVTNLFASMAFLLLLLSACFVPATSMPGGTGSDVCFYAKNPGAAPCHQETEYFCCQNLKPNDCCSNDGPWQYCDTMGGDLLQSQYRVNFFKKTECSRGNFGQCTAAAPRGTHCCSKRWYEYGGELTGEMEECSIRLEVGTDYPPNARVIDKRSAGASGNVTDSAEGKEESKRSVCRRPNAIGYRDGAGVFHHRVFAESQFEYVLALKECGSWSGLARFTGVLPPRRYGA
ncbi:uncharacterized protein RHO25_006908 [Cercospora beticola]|uniref:Uncharacterized protein n=1 Tax=Cercospora beticola TaxID=122368 RepID=A0ABZ0NRU1_CERBT|nr:hypothetical protein RHO25_006908 [Cercospora beticola]CAK1362856.1 unnamed protein product [Cercospora beticola]